MSDINLVPVEEKAQAQAEEVRKRLQVIAIGLLAVTAVATIFTLLFFTTSVSKKNDLIAKVENSSTVINQYKSQEELLIVTKDKVSAAESLLGSRTNYNFFFKNLAGIIPQGIYFTDMRISDIKVAISGRARTSADVAGLVSALKSSTGSALINGVTVDSLSSDEHGVYAFVISGKLVKTKT